jgi:excisionase family DNA binding protein
MDETLLSVNQVAIILKVHPLTVRRYIKEGKIQALKAGGNIRIPQSALDNMTQKVYPTNYGIKKPKADKSPHLTPQDPIFRLKARGLSLKMLNLTK